MTRRDKVKVLRVLGPEELEAKLSETFPNPILGGREEVINFMAKGLRIIAQAQLDLDRKVVAELQAEIAALKDAYDKQQAKAIRIIVITEADTLKAVGKWLRKRWYGVRPDEIEALESGNKPKGM